MAEEQKHRLTLHIPHELHKRAQEEAKVSFTSVTGLILRALSIYLETDKKAARK